MEELFVPYEESLALKELGFDEQCLGYYSPSGSELRLGEKGMYVTRYYRENVMEYVLKNSRFEYGKNVPAYKLVMSPLYQQAFKWFREKHKLKHSIDPELDVWVIELRELNGIEGNPAIIGYPDLEYKTYEEAELECLRRLIEIVKN